MQDALDKILETQGVRLTPRAKQFLLLVFDGLMNEPLQWDKPGTPPPPPEKEWEMRIRLVENSLDRLPGLLQALPNKYTEVSRDEFITLFNLLHHFETLTLDIRNMFFPNKF